MLNGPHETGLSDVYRALVRHRKKAMLFFLIVVAGAVVYVMAASRVYESNAKLFVRLGRENATLSPADTLGEKPVAAIPHSREEEINSVVEMLGSRAMIERVVDRLGPSAILEPDVDDLAATTTTSLMSVDRLRRTASQWAGQVTDTLRGWLSDGPIPARDAAVRRLEKKLVIESPRKSNVVRLGYQAHSPEAARQVIDALIDAYLREHARLNRTPGSEEFYAAHAERLPGELRGKEEELRELKQRTGLASVDEQRTQLISRTGVLEDELIAVEAKRAESEAKVASLREKLAALPKIQIAEETTGIGHTGTEKVREQLYALQVREKEASAIYTDAHPRLRAIREELAEAEAIALREDPLRTHTIRRPDSNYEAARLALLAEEPTLAALTAKSRSLRDQLAGVRDQLHGLNENEAKVVRLMREIELREQDFRKYSANLEQARIDGALEARHMSNISVVQPATLELKPVRPRKTLVLGLAMIVGLGGAFGLALMAEYVDHSFQEPEQIERHLNLPALVAIPRMSRKALKLNGRN